MPKKTIDSPTIASAHGMADIISEVQRQEALLRAGALQNAIFNSANFSSIATDAKGVIQIFNVGAERMLGYTAVEVVNKITPAEISDPQEVIARAETLSLELETPIAPGFDALVFKASRGIEDIYELTYIRKDGSRFPAVVSVTALRDAENAIIGYLLIGTDNTARKQAEEALLRAGALQTAIFKSANFSSIATDAKGVIQIFNVGAERMLGYTAVDVVNKITPAEISDPQELIARAETLSLELETPIAPGFEALVFKASRGIEDIYELTYIRKDGSRFPAVVSVTALRDEESAIIGYLLIGTDNTARKQAEEALLRAGALQNAIFNSANFSSIATDAKGVIQIFNVGAERMLGYTAVEVVNKITPAEISDPQEVIARAETLSLELETPIAPGFDALVFKASRGIEDIYELTYIRKDGSRFPAVVSVTALRDAESAIIGYLLIGTDNTARKQAEEALLRAGALQNAIFNSANFSSIATDAKGVIQIFNVGAERMLGYTAVEVVNKITPAEISDPQEVIARAKTLSLELETPIAPGFEALVFKASRGIEDIYELTYIRKDGSRFPAVVSVTALRDADNAIIGYLLIGTDNTVRKQVEEERIKLDQRLRDQQFYTRSLIESNIDAIMTTDPRGIITDANKQMEALTGCTRDELIGAPFKKYFTNPERAEAGIKQVLTEGNITDYELTARSRDGKETVVSYNATTFYNRDRILQGVFASARDVTERKRLDRELKQTKEAAEAANRAKSIFLANMSHEIRTPMNAILGFAQLMLRDAEITSSQREHLEIIGRSGASLLALINDILEMSKIEAGRVMFVLSTFDVHALVNDLGTMLRVRAESKGLTLSVDINEDVPQYVVTDEDKLRRTLINLVGNAIKFTEYGSVCVRVYLKGIESGQIRLGFEIKDTGIGILAHELARVFGAFEQVGVGHKDEGGTGLGLAISKEFVTLMGGELTVSSEFGMGSVFRFDIVAQEGTTFQTAPVEAVRRVSRLIPGQKSPRIAIVDDIEVNRRLLREFLQGVGFEICEAANGIEAVALAQKQSPDLMLMDMKMPLMDGYEATRQIKGTEVGQSIYIVGITASALDDNKQVAIEAGVDGFVAKPFTEEALFNEIRRLLKIEYEYENPEDTQSAADVAVLPTDLHQAVVALPQELITEMREAVSLGYAQRLNALLTQVELLDLELAERLRGMAERFEYDALLAILSGPEQENR